MTPSDIYTIILGICDYIKWGINAVDGTGLLIKWPWHEEIILGYMVGPGSSYISERKSQRKAEMTVWELRGLK